jgi:hypothetical protein
VSLGPEHTSDNLPLSDSSRPPAQAKRDRGKTSRFPATGRATCRLPGIFTAHRDASLGYGDAAVRCGTSNAFASKLRACHQIPSLEDQRCQHHRMRSGHLFRGRRMQSEFSLKIPSDERCAAPDRRWWRDLRRHCGSPRDSGFSGRAGNRRRRSDLTYDGHEGRQHGACAQIGQFRRPQVLFRRARAGAMRELAAAELPRHLRISSSRTLIAGQVPRYAGRSVVGARQQPKRPP